MADLAPPPPPTTGIYAPGAATASAAKSAQAWRAIVGWVSVLFGLLVQVFRGTPSMVQFLASVRIRHPSLFSAEGDGDSPAYKPLAAIEAAALPVVDVDGDEGAGEERTKRMMIVLDLDETLVCAYDTPSLPKTVRNQAIEAGLKCFDLECLSSEKDADGRRKKNQVTVFERPGLREFLKQTSEFADLVLFTAGLEDYARPVVDKIDIGNKLSRRLYRPATVSTEFREHVKDLSCLSKDLSRVVIVDNNPFSFLLQPLNGIPCVPFSAGQPYDEQLLGVILPLLKHLSQQEDVRTVLHEKFHMPEWFNQNGIPTTFWPS